MIRRIAFVLSILALSSPALAQKKGTPQGPFDGARGFKCSFPVYDTARWTGTKPEVLAGEQTFAFDLDSFDFKKGRARLASESGATLTSMVLTDTGLNVIEQTPIGNFNLTTVFVAGGTGTTYLAVNSRHNGDLSSAPKISQNYGTCEMVK